MWSYAHLEFGHFMLENPYNKFMYSTSKSHNTNIKTNMQQLHNYVSLKDLCAAILELHQQVQELVDKEMAAAPF